MSSILSTHTLSLYHAHPSRSFRSVWLASHLNLLPHINLIPIHLLRGAQYRPEFTSINPMSSIPVLVITDKHTQETTILTESTAIVHFLVDLTQLPSLKPPTSNIGAYAVYTRFLHFAAGSMDPLLWDIRRNEVLLPKEKRLTQVANKARREFKTKVIPVLMERLNKDDVEFLCEPEWNGLTAADVVVGYSLYWANAVGGLLEDNQVLQTYLKRLMDMEAFKEAVKVGQNDAAL